MLAGDRRQRLLLWTADMARRAGQRESIANSPASIPVRDGLDRRMVSEQVTNEATEAVQQLQQQQQQQCQDDQHYQLRQLVRVTDPSCSSQDRQLLKC